MIKLKKGKIKMVKFNIRKDIIYYIKHPIQYLKYKKAAKAMANDYMEYLLSSGRK